MANAYKISAYVNENLKELPAPSIEPLDIVYTRVDSADLQWQDKFTHTYKELRKEDGKQYVMRDIRIARWNNRDELRYSLRSVEKNLKIVINKIHIVTMSQIPDWLNVDHPKINIVDHTEIIEKKYLPTFSSSAIAANIHKIKGLGKYFIYINDDVFLGSPVIMDDFIQGNKFTSYLEDGKVSFRGIYSQYTTPMGFIFEKYNSVQILNKYICAEHRNFMAHIPFFVKTSDCFAFAQWFKDEFETTTSNKFRARNNICPFTLYHFYNYHKFLGKKIICDNTSLYYRHWDVTDDEDHNAKNYKEYAANPLPKFFVVNDNTTSPNPNVDKQFNDFMTLLFPEKSSFEK